MEMIVCNMCMITNEKGEVLVQDRLPKPTNPWCGLTFPGGHMENGESALDSVVREIREETGLEISQVRNCGYIQWYNPEKQSQYFVFLYRTSVYSGVLRSSSEGRMSWMTLDQMRRGGMAPNMELYLQVFLNEEIPQAYGIAGKGLELCRQV